MIQPGDILIFMEAAAKSSLSIRQLKERVDQIDAFRIELPQPCVWQKSVPMSEVENWDHLDIGSKLELIVDANVGVINAQSQCEHKNPNDDHVYGEVCNACRRFQVNADGIPLTQITREQDSI